MLRSMATRQTQVSTLKAAAGQPSAGEARAGLMQPSLPRTARRGAPGRPGPAGFIFCRARMELREGGRPT